MSKTDDDWHNIQIVKNSEGKSELIIENLDNLNEKTTLVLKRHG